MTERETKSAGGKKARKAQAAADEPASAPDETARAAELPARAFYVYCVGRRDELARVFEAEPPADIEGTAPVELAAAGELAAVVSAVPLADYGEEALAARLAEPAWVAARAMRHEAVVEHFARRATVVPLRFGTVYLSREGVGRMLGARRDEVARVLERLRGREEWGVNLYVERERLKEAVATLSPRLRELAERAAAEPPGQAYLLRKKIDALRADESRLAVKRVAAEVEASLAAASDGAARLRLHKGEASEHGDLAAKLAFLVSRRRFAEFRRSAERLAAELAPAGFRIELTGPWPAYNFVAGGEAGG